MDTNIESGTFWIEDPTDLGLNLDKIKFERIESLETEKRDKVNVYDLEVENQHNYVVDGLGIVHNGGGK